MQIGGVIKALRKEQGITQEKLAGYLGISYQAVSKWENGTALPDITLIIPIANFFNVSADKLFSLNQEKNDEKVNEYLAEYKRFLTIGDMPACIELMRKALSEYPRNFELMHNLASSLWLCKVNGQTDDVNEEVVNLCERILEDCNDDKVRYNAVLTLCNVYPLIGQRQKVVELAHKMPDMYASSNILLERIYTGDERIALIQNNLLNHIYCAFLNLNALSCQRNITIDERIVCLKTAVKLFELVFYDGVMGFYHCWVVSLHSYLAECYMQKNDLDKAMECLLLAEKHSIAHDETTELGNKPVTYTSLFFNKVEHASGQIKNFTETQREKLLKDLSRKCFAPLLSNDEFINVKKRLQIK